MIIGTAVFSYNRSEHIYRTLNALKNNYILPNKLYIFQDGARAGEDLTEWKKVNEIIKAVDWCEREIIVSNKNFGLADSVCNGVNYVLSQCDAIIVLEDDCLAHHQFMEFMVSSLNYYKEDKNVFSVSGYSEATNVEKDEYDAYFTGRISSWGWGTWKDRWKFFKRDYEVLRRIKRDSYLSEALKTWGQDLESMIVDCVTGKNDSWAVFWALTVIENNGYNLAPYECLVDNIGFDGSGVHCGTIKPWFNMQKGDICSYRLPPKTFFRESVKIAISDYYANIPGIVKERKYKEIALKLLALSKKGINIADCLSAQGICEISIWGINKFTDIVIDDCKERIKVNNIILSKAREDNSDYRGIPICTVDKMKESSSAIVVIPYYDFSRIIEKCKNAGYQGLVIGLDSLIDKGYDVRGKSL